MNCKMSRKIIGGYFKGAFVPNVNMIYLPLKLQIYRVKLQQVSHSPFINKMNLTKKFNANFIQISKSVAMTSIVVK